MSGVSLSKESEIPELKKILDTIDLFPSEMLDEMMRDYLTNPDTAEIWFTARVDNEAIAFGYCAPEKLTVGTYNLYAIGVKKDIQAKGVGTKMMHFIEDHLKKKGQRILIVDTSSNDDYALTKEFYKKLGYKKEAVIRDFWDEGDDKIIFWKRLN